MSGDGMNRSILKNTLRSISKTKGRFLAIFAIIALGSGFFAGVKVTSPDMKLTADTYYKDTHLADLHLKSTVGFSREELDLLCEREGVSGCYGGYSADLYLHAEDTASAIARVWSMDFTQVGTGSAQDLNTPVLREGRWPERPDECLIEVRTPAEFQIGDTLTLDPASADESVSDTLNTDTFTIVGVADWSMYVDFERGTTTVGNGKVESYILVQPEAFCLPVYTDIFLTLKDAQGLFAFDEAYTDTVTAYAEQLEADAPEIYCLREEQLRADAQEELDKARKELEDGWAEYATGKQELADQLAEARQELEDGNARLEEQISQLAEKKTELEQGEKTLAASQKKLDGQRDTLTAQQAELQKGQQALSDAIRFSENLLAAIENYRYTCMVPPLDAQTEQLIDSASVLDGSGMEFTAMLRQYITEPVDAAEKGMHASALKLYAENYQAALYNQQGDLDRQGAQLDSARKQLASAQNTLDAKQKELEQGKQQLQEGEQAIEDARKELESGQQELEEQRILGEQKLADAKAELEQGEAELKESEGKLDTIGEQITWYVLDRSNNIGYSSFAEDADRVDSIARVFPVFFILVACLVCLTTMTRMVEEQRTEIGTLKALGYSSATVMGQYLLYSMAASLLGVFIGVGLCTQVFPRVLYAAYLLMYNLPPILCPFHWGYALGSLGAALLCTGATSLAACYVELISVPAQLMRPKPPKNGKRVLLERIGWLWKRLGFHAKVTIRNVFRYKNRVLMTVVGVAGCTALMLTGFGLRNAISVIVDLQYSRVYQYDLLAVYDPDAAAKELDALQQCVADTPELTDTLYAMQKSATVTGAGGSMEAYLFVPEDPARLPEFVRLIDRKTDAAYSLEEQGAVITEKMARMLDVAVGDQITLEGAAAPVTVTAITENYVYHYVYLTPGQYAALYGDYQSNSFVAKLAEGSSEDGLSETLLANEAVRSLSYTSHAGDRFHELLGSLNYVVLLIIISSGALAFVVLYNLANINITERMRELATFKVLGFYDREVAAYIYRENTISAMLGMLAGLVLGIFLCHFVVDTAQVDAVMFYPDIPAYAFGLAALLTAVFTVLVNGLLYFKLRRIDMAGSMKAIE